MNCGDIRSGGCLLTRPRRHRRTLALCSLYPVHRAPLPVNQSCAMSPADGRATLSVIVLILLLMQVVCCQGHREQWGRQKLCGRAECKNGGECVKGADGEAGCDCSRTGFDGSFCSLTGTTYRFNGGLIQLTYPPQLTDPVNRARFLSSSTKDTLTLRFKTRMAECTLLHVYSESSQEFLNVTLERGRPIVQYNLGRQTHTVKDDSSAAAADPLNDGSTHLLLFFRDGPNSTLQIDRNPPTHYTTTAGKEEDILNIFNDQAGLLVGGYRSQKQIEHYGSVNGDFVGEMSGLYFNRMKVLSLVALGTEFQTIQGDVTLRPETMPSLEPFLSDPLYSAFITPDAPAPALQTPDDCDFQSSFLRPRCHQPRPSGDSKDDKSQTPTSQPQEPAIKVPPKCTDCSKFQDSPDTTQSDQAAAAGCLSLGCVNSGPKDDTISADGTSAQKDSQRGSSIRMSTTAAGMTIGVVASIMLAMIILIYAVYKMRHKNLQQDYRVTTSLKMNSLKGHHHSPNNHQFPTSSIHLVDNQLSLKDQLECNGGANRAGPETTSVGSELKEWYV